MYNEDNLSQDEDEKKLRKNMREKGKHLKRAESAYDRLSDAEKIFVNYFFNDPNISPGAAVWKSGLVTSPEDLVNVTIALMNNDRIKEAIAEVEKLGGITPAKIKKGILKLAENSEDENIQLKAWQTLGKYYGMEFHIVKHEGPETPVDVEEVRNRINSKLPDVLAESKEIIAAKKRRDNSEEGEYTVKDDEE